MLEPRDPARTFADVLDALPIIAYMARPDGAVTYFSQAWAAATGIDRERVLGYAWADYLFADDRERAMRTWEAARSSESPYRDELRFRFADGTYHWLLSQSAPVRDEQGRVIGWFGTVTVADDRKRLELGLRLLSSIGAAATRSLDYPATLRNFANALVEEFASYCIIDIEDAEHEWERIVAHRDPARVGRLRALTHPSESHPISLALQRGESQALLIDDGWLAEVSADSDRAEVVHDFAVRSVIIVPVRASDGSVIGAITAGIDSSDRTGRLYLPEDVPFLEEVGRRAGASIVNARLFERQRRIAVELQSASLPLALPAVPGVRVDAFYQPGSDEATIGGDWYDAFALTDGRVAMTVGDVRGHGLQAAIAMTKLRQAMQSAAMVDPDPSVMLAVADRTMRLVDPDAFATALAAIYDPVAGTLAIASAGHPPALIVQDDRVEELTVRGPMLGLAENERYTVQHVDVVAFSTLVFYTDGLIEATRDWEVGAARLREALLRDDILSATAPARKLVHTVLGGVQSSDDIAVLIARLEAVDAPVTPQTSSPTSQMNWTFSSDDATGARAVRRAFAAFVEALEPRRIDVAGAELVLGELMGNVVRHAPGRASVSACWTAAGIELCVASEGPCFTPPQRDPNDTFAESGRGLMLVRTFADELRITGSARDCEVRVTIPFRS